jgi:uroporphyrinogen decarboxylase
MNTNTEELTTKERMRRLHNKEPLDRVPVTIRANLYAAKITNTPFKDFWTDPEKHFRALSLTIDFHGSDDTPSYGYGWNDSIVSVLGGEVQFADTNFGLPTVIKRTVEKPADVDKLVFPDAVSSPVIRRQLECTRMNVKNGGKAVIQIGVTGLVGSILGSAKLLRWYINEPNAVHLLFRKVTDYLLSNMTLYIKEFGVDNIAVAEGLPWDSHNLISPATFEKFGFIYIKEIHEKAVLAGVKTWQVHLCGNHTNNIPLWKRIPIPPRTTISIGSENDIKKTAEFFGPDHIIYANVPTQLIQFGTPEEVMEKCKEIINQVKYHPGGFILGPACSMPAAAPPINVQTMVKAAKLYGRYN